MFSFFPKDDPAQALRIRRFSIGAASYLMWMGLLFYCHTHGFLRLPMTWLIVLFLFFISIQLVFYGILRSGINKHLADPSMTMPQMMVAALGAMTGIYFTDVVRGVMLLAYIVTILFGVFRFRMRHYIAYTFFSMASYSLVIWLLCKYHPEHINLKIELLQWVVLGAVLIWFSIVGAYISGLRKKISHANRELQSALNIINELAIHDDLTKVYNRRHLFEELQRQKALADRGKNVFSIAMVDLDHFKRANDTYGHLMGDEILKHLIQTVKHEIREADCLARYGGEEFIIVMSSTDIKEAEECAQRVKKTVEKLKFPGFPESFGITISIGITVYKPVESIEQLIARADAALYRAKTSGRNQVVLEYPDLL